MFSFKALFALLFFLKSFALGAVAQGPTAHAEFFSGAARFAGSENCASSPRNGGGGRQESGHIDCCILCPSSCAAGHLCSASVLAAGAEVYLPAAPIISVAAAASRRLGERTLAWATSWSSRGPPFFS